MCETVGRVSATTVLARAEELRSLDIARLSTDDLGPMLSAVTALTSVLQAQALSLVAAALDRGVPETCIDGGMGAREWVADWQGEGPRQAGRTLTKLRQLSKLPTMRQAWQRGLVTPPHVEAALRAVEQVQAAALPLADRILTEAAVTVLPEDLTMVVRRLVHTVDPDGSAKRAEELTEGQHLTLDQFGDGSWDVHGLLCPAAGAMLASALAPLMLSNGPDDTRTTPRRRADALTEMARRSSADPEGPGAHGVRPTVLLLVDSTGQRPAETADGTVLDRGAALALACDASTYRLDHAACPQSNAGGSAAFPAAGRRGGVLPLELGRATRLATKAQVLALIARDRGCVHPRCARPPSWTQAHHLVEWSAGGRTDVTMMALLCTEHHTMLHRTRQHLHPPARPGAPWTMTSTPPTRSELTRALGPPVR